MDYASCFCFEYALTIGSVYVRLSSVKVRFVEYETMEMQIQMPVLSEYHYIQSILKFHKYDIQDCVSALDGLNSVYEG